VATPPSQLGFEALADGADVALDVGPVPLGDAGFGVDGVFSPPSSTRPAHPETKAMQTKRKRIMTLQK